ncbi:MAG: DNA methyltransferase [Candidatus Hodarchaeota archaeon]
MKNTKSQNSLDSRFYEKLERNYKVISPPIKNATYFNIANYTPDLNKPIQRWYRYKEGYSLALNEKIFKEFSVTSGDIICDPFCGGGTTLLYSFLNNVKSIGFEVNPFTVLLAKAKTRFYSQQDIRELEKQIRKINIVTPNGDSLTKPKLSFIDKVFDPEVLNLLLAQREHILSIINNKVRELLFLAWLSILEDLSNYRKAGNGLKRKERIKQTALIGKEENARYLLNTKLEIILKDLENFYGRVAKEYEPIIYNVSALDMLKYLPESSLKGVIFSPPYANCFDYTEIYKIELWMGSFVKEYSELKELRKVALRSHLSAGTNRIDSKVTSQMAELDELNELLETLSTKGLWDKKIPLMLNGYFEDILEALNKIYNCLKPKGFCCIVVSNSAYGGVVIPTDLLIARIAEIVGFDNLRIDVARYIITSSQQYKKTEFQKKYLRESIIYLRK